MPGGDRRISEPSTVLLQICNRVKLNGKRLHDKRCIFGNASR